MGIPYRIITISGLGCSGTTTLTRLLSKAIGWPHSHPASEQMRTFLHAHQLPLSAMDQLPDEQEVSIDNYLKSIIQNSNHQIVNGRLSGWHAQGIGDVFKVFVTASDEKRVERFAARENYSIAQAGQELKARDANEFEKYKRLYGADATDPKLYDLIIDTTNTTPQECLDLLLNKIGAIQENKG